jgi:poly(A) polymerase
MTAPPAQTWAVEIVQRLRAAGFQSLFAGGCVRDMLLGIEPKDYDVATDARPEQIQTVFKRDKTLAIGAAFGVIAIVGRKAQGTVEVATFRQDLGYTDGRRPDAVAFCSPQKDAQRRDFTINGLFYDPLSEQVLDYVGGQADLAAGIIRAIGDPQQRFTEDKLRLLRAIRFTARFGFALDHATRTAIEDMAPGLQQVSAERISDELRKLMSSPRRALGWQLLRETQLLTVIWPEWLQHANQQAGCEQVERELNTSESLPLNLAWAIMLAPLVAGSEISVNVGKIGRRMKWSNDEIAAASWLIEHRASLLQAATEPWSVIQPLLIHDQAAALAQWTMIQGAAASAAWCRERLAWPAEQLNPPLLVTGSDLIRKGYRPGPRFSAWLQTIRDRQLDGEFRTADDAWAWLEREAATG